MNEADLTRIRTALEKPTLEEACQAMTETLMELGWRECVYPTSLRKRWQDE